MIDEKTTFELHLLARAFELVLLRVDARAAYWPNICRVLARYRDGAGLPVSWYARGSSADKMSLSRMLAELADENRIQLSGRTRAHAARLSPHREAELLGLADTPDMPAVYATLKATATTRCSGIGDGWQLLVDRADQERDRQAETYYASQIQFCVVPAVLKGWAEWMPSLQTGYVFVRITPDGKKRLESPPPPAGLESDQQAADIFTDALTDAREAWTGTTPGTSQNIGDIPIPYSFGDLPRQTVCRMMEGITLPE
jgi:hypothetical protein